MYILKSKKGKGKANPSSEQDKFTFMLTSSFQIFNICFPCHSGYEWTISCPLSKVELEINRPKNKLWLLI